MLFDFAVKKNGTVQPHKNSTARQLCKIGTLVHRITLMTKRRLQVCKQQQTASGNKLVNLHFCL